MDGTELAALVEIGQQLFAVKLFTAAIHFVWIYDYFLTLRDELTFAWNGRKSWVFALFIANRYCPVLPIIWSIYIMYNYTSTLCQNTKWLAIVQATIVIVLAEITAALRIYAVTDRSKWAGGALSSLIAAQLIFGIYSIVLAAIRPMEQLPEINLDPFKFCVFESWKLGELLFVNIAVAFDVLSFIIILIAARRPRCGRYPGIPSILDTILRDATHYFILMFLCEFLFDLFIFFTPGSISLFPGLASAVLIPLMASRLMLSLKKAAVEPGGMWTLSTMTSLRGEISTEDRIPHFASRVPCGSQEAPETPLSPKSFQEGMELESMSRSSGKVVLR